MLIQTQPKRSARETRNAQHAQYAQHAQHAQHAQYALANLTLARARERGRERATAASPGTDIEGRRVAAPASRDGRDPNDSDDGADGPAALPAGDLRRFMGPLRHQAPERMLGLQACVRVRACVCVCVCVRACVCGCVGGWADGWMGVFGCVCETCAFALRVRVRVGVSVGVGVTLSPSHSVYLSH